MSHQQSASRGKSRRGTAAVELAVVLPFLAFVFIVAIDYCRIFYYSLTIQNAALNGAAYGCQDATHAADTSGIQTAALADASNLSPAPHVSSAAGTDADGNPKVDVTVSYTFTTITRFPGIPTTSALSRTVSMRVIQ
jgi:Flp pilus assembly protein TadG